MDTIGVKLGSSTIRLHVRKLGFTLKQPSSVPNTPRVEELRRCFAQHQRDLDADAVISIDETAVYFHMPPKKGWSLRGQRLRAGLSTHHKDRVTLLMVVASTGVVHWEALKGSVTADRFATFIASEQIRKAPQQSLLLDNAAFHKTKSVQAAANQSGKSLVFLPPYTPQFQPIEHAFSVFKHQYRRIAPNNAGIEDRIVHAVSELTTEKLSAMFIACWARRHGYLLPLTDGTTRP